MERAGRPRKSDVDRRILDAFAELIGERGYARVTLDALVARAGTNKPAFYRRYRSLAAVVPALLAARHGTDEDIDTGSIVGDLVEVQERQRRLFSDPVVVRGLAGWAAAVDADPDVGLPFSEGYLALRREYTRVILSRAAARGEIAAGADPDWIADLLTGPLLMRVIFPGLPPVDDRLGAQTVHAALDVLGFTGDRAAVRA